MSYNGYIVDTFTALHDHSEYSSATLKFADSINRIDKCVEWAYNNGLRGYAITDHQCVSGYVELEKAVNNLNIERPFTHIYGNEFYLLSEEEDNLRYSETERPTYWHYLVLCLDEIGLKQMYELSTMAWERSYTYKGLIRRPSFYSDFEKVVGEDKGHLVCSSGCIGGYLPKCILNGEPKKAKKFIEWNERVLGKGNFFLEVQPCLADNEEQRKVNKTLWSIHEKMDVPIIVTTDSHFMRPEDRKTHTAYLLSKDGGGEREPDKFYQTTYMFTPQELRDMLKSGSDFTDEQVNVMFQTTNDIADRVQKITIKKTTQVPALPEFPDVTLNHYFRMFYEKYPHFAYYANSKNTHERYFFAEIENNLHSYIQTHKIDLETYIARLDIEFEQIKGLGDVFDKQKMCDYFTTVQKIIDVIWEDGDSMVGIGRGSANCYLTNFLLNIVGIDPLIPEFVDFFPWWRFCSIARSDSMFDCDIDVQSFKKEQIIQAIKDYFGVRRVSQCVTWGRISSKTALEKAGKGLGIRSEDIGYLKSLIPNARGYVYTLSDCLYGNKGRGLDKVPAFIAEVNNYPDLLDVALNLEGMITSMGVHAGACVIYKEDFTESTALLKASNGSMVSQYDLHALEYSGGLKFDLLSTDCQQILRTALDLLVEDGKMEWKGSLRKTYEYYLSYDALEQDSPEMWKMLPTMPQAFQYDSVVGKEALRKIGASNLVELTLANGLMRLSNPNGEMPMDRYIRYRSDINEWYQDMTDYGVPKDEQEILKRNLLQYKGLALSQESVMSLLMQPDICNFTMKEADKARKAISKKNKEALDETEERLFRKGKECGRSDIFLKYLWEEEIGLSRTYSFNLSHSVCYSTECLQELNLYYRFPKIYWNAAVAITQAQTEDDRENVSTSIDYGKISASISKANKQGIEISTPNINYSKVGFTVDEKHNLIFYGLGVITSINQEISAQILSNRPYTSFQDFYNKNTYTGSLVTDSKIVQLIKAGCFNEFGTRTSIMKHFLYLSTPRKESLTLANLPEAISLGVDIPRKLLSPYNFKKYVCDKPFFYGNHPNFKSKKLYWLDDKALKYFNKNCRDSLVEGSDWWEENDKIVVVDKSLDKLFKENTEQIKAFLAQPEIVEQFNRAAMQKKYDKICPVKNESRWCFESVNYYADLEHELAPIDYAQYNLSAFRDLPTEPVFEEKSMRGRTWKQYELTAICGTVIAKDDNRNMITLLTPEYDTVSIKLSREVYAHYKRQIADYSTGERVVLETPWIARGNLLIVSGYRRENDFVAKKYKNSIYKHQIQRIFEVYPDGTALIQSERNIPE